MQDGLTVTPGFTDATATAGTDYTENTAALSFTGTAGEEQTLTVKSIEDAVVEDDETFTVSLSVSDAPSGVTVGGPATGTITDDDGGSDRGIPTGTIASARAAEGEALTFTVRLNRAVEGGLTVTPSFTDGTATSGTHYTGNTAALSFTGTAGEEQTLTVKTVEDTVVEKDETFTVSLSVSDAPSGVTVGGPRHRHHHRRRRLERWDPDGDDRQCKGRGGRSPDFHREAEPGGAGRAEGDAELH